jgi:cysteine desulfurase/selenocysteine lyase
LDILKIRADFPILSQKVYEQPLVYLDNAATTQKPLIVTDTVSNYYNRLNSNIHRGAHFLSTQATEAFESGRRQVKSFINAAHAHEIIFTRGTTESINLVASSFGKRYISAGDEIIISAMEHHSNIVPWQMVCEERGAVLKVIPISDAGELLMDEYEKLLGPRVKIVAVTQLSNALGTVNPVHDIIRLAHQANIPVLIDGAQGIQHARVNVQEMDCDFYVFSGHKMYAPLGIGVLYGKEKWLNEMPPWQGGGEMIKTVTFEKTTYNELPFKFEAGTPDVAGVIGLDAAIKYLNKTGFDDLMAWEDQLFAYALKQIGAVEGLRMIGQAGEHKSVISFLLNNIHPFDAGSVMDHFGIAVRTGHHCAQPLMQRLGIPGTVRASFSFYNTFEEVDKLVSAIKKVQEMFN